MTDNQLPAKLTFFQRLALGPELQKAIEEARQILEREEAVSNREKAVSEREKSLNKSEQDYLKRLGELRKEQEEVNAQKKILEAKVDATEKTIDVYREKKEVEPEISDKSLTRDLILKRTLDAIKESGEKILIRKKARSGVKETVAEVDARNKDIAKLKANTIGLIALYRDTLPEKERDLVTIKGKSIAAYLKEQAVDMLELYGYAGNNAVGITLGRNRYQVPRELLQIAGDTYKRLGKEELKLWAGKAYEGAAYRAFENGLSIEDERSIHMALMTSVLGERIQTIDLENTAEIGSNDIGWPITSKTASTGVAGAPRAVLDDLDKSELEEGIDKLGTIISEIDEPEQ